MEITRVPRKPLLLKLNPGKSFVYEKSHLITGRERRDRRDDGGVLLDDRSLFVLQLKGQSHGICAGVNQRDTGIDRSPLDDDRHGDRAAASQRIAACDYSDGAGRGRTLRRRKGDGTEHPRVRIILALPGPDTSRRPADRRRRASGSRR